MGFKMRINYSLFSQILFQNTEIHLSTMYESRAPSSSWFQNILKRCFIFLFKENYKYLDIPVGKGFPKRRYLVIP